MLTTRQHPSLEKLAAFAEGRLAGEDSSQLAEHLSQCRECYALFAATAEFVEEEHGESSEAVQSTSGRFNPGWLLAAAAVLVLVVGSFVLLRDRPGESSRSLVAAANALPYRVTEGRLAGEFEWRALPPVVRSGEELGRDPKWMLLQGAAGETLDESTRATPHERAVAHLMTGDNQRAIELLDRVVSKEPANAAAWSDLSAAWLARSRELDDASMALRALVASDAALEIDSNLPSARFNRALALEGMGLLDQAREAWERYLALDSSSGWAGEAREHVKKLEFRTTQELWKEQLALLEAAARAGSADRVTQIVTRFPEQARRWGEGIYLANWAEAQEKGDYPRAAAELSVARAIGAALYTRGGEAMLRDAVRAIDDASAGIQTDRRQWLTRAHLLYREGRMLHSRSQPAEGEAKLREAERLFRKGGSPLALVTEYYTASALFQRGRLDESGELLDALVKQPLERSGYRSLAAQIQWERGLSRLVRNDYDGALAILSDGRQKATEISERFLRASFDSFLAQLYEHLGDPARASNYRRDALAALAREGNLVTTTSSLDALTSSLALRGDWASVNSLTAIVIGLPSSGNEITKKRAFVWRGLAGVHLGDSAATRDAFEELNQWAATTQDRDLREWIESDRARLAAALIGQKDPVGGIRELTRSIDFAVSRRLDTDVPQLMLERGLLHRRAGDIEGAKADFENGMRRIENARLDVGNLADRASFLATHRSLFHESLRIAMERSSPSEVFLLAERKLARELLDAVSYGRTIIEPVSATAVQQMLSDDDALLQFIELPDAAIVTVVRRSTIRSLKLPLDHDAFTRQITTLSASDDDRDSLRAAAQIHASLITPITPDLEGANRVVIVSDGALRRIPFAALYNGAAGRFLIESMTVIEAPSASLAVHLSRASNPEASAGRSEVLLIAPAAVGLDRLDASNQELRELQRLYPSAISLRGRDATKSRVLRSFSDAALIHFAGHGVSDPRWPHSSNLILWDESTGENTALLASEISALRLPRSRLVVLGACESGRAQRSSGIDNVATAFLAAGSDAVVASRWKIEDDFAAMVMTEFHRQLLRGSEAPSALRAAILPHTRSTNGFPRAPRKWATLYIFGT